MKLFFSCNSEFSLYSYFPYAPFSSKGGNGIDGFLTEIVPLLHIGLFLKKIVIKLIKNAKETEDDLAER